MSEKTNCPCCGKTNVKGRRMNSVVPGFTIIGGVAGFSLGPLGPLVGAPAGAAVGKIINTLTKKEYKYTCPRCGHTWEEEN